MRLSKRESVLVTILAVLLIWFLGNSRILEPAVKRRMSARQECERLELERTSVERFAASGVKVEPSAEEKQEAEFFYEAMDDVAFDRMFQRMAKESGLTIRRMEIGQPVSVSEDFDHLGNASGGEVMRTQIHLELAGTDVRKAMRMADFIDSEPASMAVSYMEILRENRRLASESEAAVQVVCRMDVDIYWIKPQTAGKGAR
ncbi:MAG: hypothetical protein KH230_04710 [Enterocloster asparagiformis]|nr:hypothetical protein [Enterocloster asparagiformis]